MNTPTIFSAGQAAKEAGVAKSTISKYIASGKLSAKKNVKGGWDIQAAELFRVFPKKPVTSERIEQTETPTQAPETHPEFIRMKAELAAARDQISELKKDKEFLQGQCTQLALTDNRSKEKASWLDRFLFRA